MSWIAASLVVLGAALAAGFAWYERTHPGSRVLALVAALAALAALGRVAFAPLPNVKPTTDIVLLSGYVLGGAPGFAVGAVAALASNLFFGQGPWTPWQMAAWGAVGCLGALLARATGPRAGRATLAAACALAAVLFGVVMNLHLWVTYSGDHTAAKLAAVFATSLPFDLAHLIGNVLFCLAFGPALVRALRRYRTRFEVRWLAAPAAAGAALLVALGQAPPARAQSADAATVSASVRYLLRAQNPDGGWGGAPGQGSTEIYTGWTVMGLAAAGSQPGRGVRYMAAHARELGDVGALERTILAVRAAGADARRVGGRDLVAELLRRRRRDGSFAGRVNTTAFAVLALRAASAGGASVRAAARWIAGQANADGGFNFDRRGGPSGIDDTGAALQALAAAGRRTTTVARRAAAFLAARQNADGGFPLQPGGTSNAQSTAWAVQGLYAAGRDPARLRHGGRDPLAYLRSLTAPSGEVRYARTSRQTPVWVTAQALMALAHKPLPIRPLPRKPVERRRADTSRARPAHARPARSPSLPRRKHRSRAAHPARVGPHPGAAAPPAVKAAVAAAADPRLAYRAGTLAGLLVAVLP